MRNSKRAMMQGFAVLAGVLTLGLANTALAFHSGGVAHCDGCHSMHQSADNPIGRTYAPAVGASVANNQLMKGTDASSTCLHCHGLRTSSYVVYSTNGSKFSPGGDFFWIDPANSYDYSVRGTIHTSNPDNNGHNIVAADYSLDVDASNTMAPGGTYPSTDLGCTSCHDPHGRVNGDEVYGHERGGTVNNQAISVSGTYGATPAPGTIAGNYRLLRDFGTVSAPVAVTAGYSEGDGSSYLADPNDPNSVEYNTHPAYGKNMSEWCASCHGDFINDQHRHPAGNGEYLNGFGDNYNSYVKTGDFGGSQATSFLQFVQYENGTNSKADLLPLTRSTSGPVTGSENVMCLTCHRAHASAFNNATRWDTETAFLVDSVPSVENAEVPAALNAGPWAPYYGVDIQAEFGDYQRGLCNKCHVKD